jgi:hypothetical protein
MNLERDLRQALRRESPPAGFAERVAARIARDERQRQAPMRWRAIAASMALAAIVAGWSAHEHARRVAEGERARDQVLLALRIAGAKVKYAQDQVREIGGTGAIGGSRATEKEMR